MDMGIATERVEQVAQRPLSADEIERRQQAAQSRTQKVATLNGEIADPPRTPTEGPHVVFKAPERTID
jgi:hypothetical protein